MDIKFTERMIVDLDQRIAEIKSRRAELYRELSREVGPCPQCNNWHYPHCGCEMEIYKLQALKEGTNGQETQT